MTFTFTLLMPLHAFVPLYAQANIIILSSNTFNMLLRSYMSHSYLCRKSSLTRGSTLNGGRIQDTRDLQSRAFLNSGVNIILNYLLEHGYNGSQVTTQKLKSPSVKEFKSITQFLFKQLDPNFSELTDDKTSDEEIITMFRQLGYPTPISKSNIASAGTPHAWPHLVAALTWLIELLSYDEAVSSEATKTEENDDTSDAFLRNYIGTSYKIYMMGDDDKHEEFKKGIPELV